MDTIWSKKYKPDNLDEVLLPDQLKGILSTFFNPDIHQNLILVGPHGVGKSTVARCLILGSLNEKERRKGFLSLECGYKNGNATISEQAKRHSIACATGLKMKIIYLDGIDMLQKDHLDELAKVMKEYHGYVRYIFTCVTTRNVPESIQGVSRTIVLPKVEQSMIADGLTRIAEAENYSVSSSAIKLLSNMCQGDYRAAINELQKVCSMNTTPDGNLTVKKKHIAEIGSFPSPTKIGNIINCCLEGELEEAIDVLEMVITQGYSFLDILTGLRKSALDHVGKVTEIDDKNAVKIAEQVVLTQMKVLPGVGVRSNLQMYALVAQIYQILQKEDD